MPGSPLHTVRSRDPDKVRCSIRGKTSPAGNAGETVASAADGADNEGPFTSSVVNIDKQKLFAWADNELLFEFDVVTG